MEFSREMTEVTGLLINKKSITAVSKKSMVNEQGCIWNSWKSQP